MKRVSKFKGVAFAIASLGLASTAAGEIIPSWRVNPIPPGLVPNGMCVSLVVSLTGDSLFDSAGIALFQSDLPGMTIFQHPMGGEDRPNPAWWSSFRRWGSIRIGRRRRVSRRRRWACTSPACHRARTS